MPLPFLLVGAAAVGVSGLVKAGEAMVNNYDAKELIKKAQSMYDDTKERCENQRESTKECLDDLGRVKLDSYANDIGRFLSLYKKFKNIDIEKEVVLDGELSKRLDAVDLAVDLKEMETASYKASEVIGGGAAALGSGALAGVALYGSVMSFASASTGTAISALSGAAATKATLAWFGGGSIASGGLGMAGGTAVLGGIVVAPILAIGGFLMAAKSEENLAKAEEHYSKAKLACEQMETMIKVMQGISKVAKNYEDFISSLSSRYNSFLASIDGIYQAHLSLADRLCNFLGLKRRVDFQKLTQREQETLHLAWLLTQILFAALSTPILKDNGELDKNAKSQLAIYKQKTTQMLGSGI